MKLYGGYEQSSRDLLFTVVKREAGLSALPKIEKQAQGKPFFPDYPQLQFSLSHSGKRTLCAIDTLPLGVDLEEIRPRGDALPRYAFTAEEYENWLRSGGSWPAFYEIWTRKEAWCKLSGRGLAALWKQFPPKNGVLWGVYRGADWRATVCGHTAPPEDILWLCKGGTSS